MKKVLSMILVLVMVFSLTACLPSPDEVGGGTNVSGVNADIDFTVPMDPAEREETVLSVWYAISGTSGEKFVE
ncbi:MAG: hypothetical protein IKU12_04255 [Oscillospiraceae bacterium]|nr:hypothetical protein [Oscillospiraceae bacterium]